MNLSRLEEPAECLKCGLMIEAYNMNRVIYEDGSPDFVSCPRCGSEDIKFYVPKEDRYEE